MGLFVPTVRSVCVALAVVLPLTMPGTALASKHTTASTKKATASKSTSKSATGKSKKHSSKKSHSSATPALSPTARLGEEFTPLAGGREQAEALVEALRTGKPQGDSPAAAIAPATGPLGYGDTRMVLKLAESVLEHRGIQQPSAQDLAAVLHGGQIMVSGVPVDETGLLVQRAQGKQWGEIAQDNGIGIEQLMANLQELPSDQIHHHPRSKHSSASKAKAGKSSQAKAKKKK